MYGAISVTPVGLADMHMVKNHPLVGVLSFMSYVVFSAHFTLIRIVVYKMSFLNVLFCVRNALELSFSPSFSTVLLIPMATG